MTGMRELGSTAPLSAAPEHVRMSVVGGRTQLDVALPVDVPVASLVPELVRLVRSRDVEAPTDTPWAATRDTFWRLSRLDPPTPLKPEETLRAAGVLDGELLRLTDERALLAPTLYDDVVDAAARLNKAAYAGWNAAAARWMSFVGLAIASLVWVCFLVDVGIGAQRVLLVGLAAMVVVGMVGVAALAHRSYGRADVGAAVGWCAIPIGAAIVWVLVAGWGRYGVAAGCALMVVLIAGCYRAVGTGHWGYLGSGVWLAAGGLAMLGHALGASARTVGVVLAVTGALACLAVSRLTARLARVEPTSSGSEPDQEAMMFETPFTSPPVAPDPDVKSASLAEMPTAEAVWEKVRAAAITRSALYAGLAATVCCGVVVVWRSGPELSWAALALAGVCAAALGVYARCPDSALERLSLGVPAAALVVAECVGAQGGTTAMAWAGLGTLWAVAVLASMAGVRMTGGNRLPPWPRAWAYLQYAAFAALIPVALWSAGVYSVLEFR